MDQTLRVEIINLLNELVKLLGKARSEEEKVKIRKKRRLFEALLYEVIDQEISGTTTEFKNAIIALESATNKAKEAKNDLQKVSETIQMVANAAKQVEKIVQLGIAILA